MPKTAPQPSPPAPGAIAGELPTAQAPQLCQLVTKPPESADWLSEIKFDGYRLIASISQSRVRLLTRRGLDWGDRRPHVAAAFARLNLTMIASSPASAAYWIPCPRRGRRRACCTPARRWTPRSAGGSQR